LQEHGKDRGGFFVVFKVCLDKPRYKRNIAKFGKYILAGKDLREQIAITKKTVNIA